MKTILVTGGTGYIGSHTVLELLDNNYNVVIVDNFSNSSPIVKNALEKLAGRKIILYNIDICDKKALEQIFKKHSFSGIINFSSYKAVGESVALPLKYYNNNMKGILTLLEVMENYKVFNLVFSSSATVYAEDNEMPLVENDKLSTDNPYARTKLMTEEILQDVADADCKWRFIALRYFNPLGAHKSGEIGESPNGIPNNLAPFITQVAIGKIKQLSVFGADYNTPDGTAIRDYVHVNDLATGHKLALDLLLNTDAAVSFETINLGSGKGYSVLEVISEFEKVIERKIPYHITARRTGDMEQSLADITKAAQLLDWRPRYQLSDMCEDSWRWQTRHPDGYKQ
ncbi:UDP-glucose 4-epimerase GalE [Macrococcus equipercicus]|uniref:UDP-glucose 4-epimerase n=1 Tax=Macrococcus equipercicus TaxID=69967 RepID=A0ABQ6R878_9STAP|nr:UDP-glucose 4-epimerase GalE [Macrococcus equipercicus]KAA1039313.1 UDP-glucose 4-epimerase GalE [Macrococcus equipercicus]